jgi:hypothetical protein
MPTEAETLYVASIVCLAMFGILGTFDGLYFHLIKFRLHAHPTSLVEHLLHAMRGVLFTPIAFLFFVVNTGGILLWVGIGIVLADLCVEVWDVLVEKRSRAAIGGVSSAEAVVHVMATGFRMAALAFIVSAKPLSAWSLSSASIVDQPMPLYIVLAGYVMLASSFFGACGHIWLLRGPGGVWSAERRSSPAPVERARASA